MIYKVLVEEVSGRKDSLLSTNDKQLAEATKQVANRLLKSNPYNAHAIISINSDEEEGRHVYWYDDNFSYNFMRDIWEMLSVLYKLDVENC